MRLRIARVLGTHKSFVSQITSPLDPTPLPARHVPPIIEVCHLSPQESETFLEPPIAQHIPNQSRGLSDAPVSKGGQTKTAAGGDSGPWKARRVRAPWKT